LPEQQGSRRKQVYTVKETVSALEDTEPTKPLFPEGFVLPGLVVNSGQGTVDAVERLPAAERP